MPRDVEWQTYDGLMQQLLAVVQDFVRHHHIDHETMMAVLVLFQASLLTAPALRLQALGAGELDAFLSHYTAEVARMVREMVARAQALGLHVDAQKGTITRRSDAARHPDAGRADASPATPDEPPCSGASRRGRGGDSP
jgi:hypothetical protein